jgi:hypothetical protein
MSITKLSLAGNKSAKLFLQCIRELTKGNDEYELDGGKDEQTGVEDDHQGRLTPRCRKHRPEGKDDIDK